jgi:outer membrane lipase/esterase
MFPDAKAPLLRFTLASLALACSQAFAAPSPYSSMIVFGDSLSDAGQFGGVRFTNLDANGNYAPVSPMILGGGWCEPDRAWPVHLPLNPALGLPDGNNWAVGGYTTQQILDSITSTSETVIPPDAPAPGRYCGKPGYLANGLRADPNACTT